MALPKVMSDFILRNPIVRPHFWPYFIYLVIQLIIPSPWFSLISSRGFQDIMISGFLLIHSPLLAFPHLPVLRWSAPRISPWTSFNFYVLALSDLFYSHGSKYHLYTNNSHFSISLWTSPFNSRLTCPLLGSCSFNLSWLSDQFQVPTWYSKLLPVYISPWHWTPNDI